MENCSYIGITDFQTYEQVQLMLDVFNKYIKNESSRRLHVGVMMSYKTLNDIETKWSKAFPEKSKIARIFSSKETMNCLHYADYDHNNHLADSLARAVNWGGKNINAIQLDMVWPDPFEVSAGVYRDNNKKPEIILQINQKAMEEENNDPKKIANTIASWYKGLVSYVLLDKSMGKGLGMDAEGLKPYIYELKDRVPEIGIVVAGGLGPESMHLVSPLVKEFPRISIDAQGRLRPSGNALDPIDWKMAEGYLIEASKLFN